MKLNDNDDHSEGGSDSARNDEQRLCLDCGYDLRGHDGDPIRCPECGGENTRADLAIAASLTEEDFKEFETGPTTAIACFLCMLGGLAFLFYGVLGCSVVLLLPATVGWVVAIRKFGRKHAFKYGWANVLIWFHMTIVSIVLVFSAIVFIEETFTLRSKLGDLVSKLVLWILVYLMWRQVAPLWNPYMIAKRKLAFLAKRSAVEKKKRGK